MPFHFCGDELIMLMAMIPFIGIYFKRIHAWLHMKLNHKCHEKSCDENHMDHK